MITPSQKQSIPFKYAYAVQNGNIVTGKRIKQAVDRFFSWINTADADGYYIDHSAGMHIINFFHTFLVHTKGKSANKPFILSPFQQFTLYNLFGWYQIPTETGAKPRRRINEVYEKEAKKNGKTAVMAGVGLYCMAFDGESGAEIYVGATKEEQAKLCFNQATEFIIKSAALKQIGFATYQRQIKFHPLNAFLKPLGGDSKTQDGINASLSIIDEYHAHKDDSVKENLESSMASRRQPIIYHITTAGVNVTSVCKNYEDVCISVLDGINQNDHLLIMIHDLDADDDWHDIDSWYKANPNLGITVEKSFLIKEFNKVKNQPSKIPNFKTKHLNMWVDAPEIWIPDEIWQKGAAPIKHENFAKYGSYAGLDLSTTIDLSAFIIISEPDHEGIRDVLPYFFCPKDTVEVRSKEDRVPYKLWVDQGYLTATPGNVIDYDEIIKTVQQNNEKQNIQNIEVDKWNATQLVAELQELGIEVSYFSQAIGNISYPTKQFEKLVYEGKIRHGGNPVLRWMLSGCAIYQDANENIKVHKGRSHMGKKRVDGIVATIMALGGSLSVEDKSNNSRYNNPEEEISFGIPEVSKVKSKKDKV